MKTIKKTLLLTAIITLLASPGIMATALTDNTDDVYHYTKTGDTWNWEPYYDNKPDIDITNVDYSIQNEEITVTLSVAGSIQASDKFFYYIYLNSEQGNYYIYYINGIALWAGDEGYAGESGIITNYTVNTNTLIASFKPNNPDTSFNVYGYAWELTSTSNMETSEWWADYAPNNYAPYYNQVNDNIPDGNLISTNDNNDKGTPGFENIILITAIAAILIILRRKK